MLDEPFFRARHETPSKQDGTYPLPKLRADASCFKLIMNSFCPELTQIVP